jgi:hypothetical protein
MNVFKRENGNNAPMAALTSLILGCNTFIENRPEKSVKRHKRSIE